MTEDEMTEDEMTEDEMTEDERDSLGNLPKFIIGDRVLCLPNKMEATVIRQKKCYDYPDWFWGNVDLIFDDDVQGECNSWQLRKL